MERLKGKVAVITGGARGMGATHAKLFVEQGAKVVIADILEQEGRILAADLGPSCHYIKLDVSSQPAWIELVNEVESMFGAIHILVANAGVAQQANLEDATDEQFDRILNINQRGAFYGTKTVAPAIRRAGGGSIVNISSIAGIIGAPGSSVYSASKGAVTAFSRACAIELAPDGIRVNSIHPGFIATDMLAEVEGAERLLPLIPLGRFGQAQEISQLALFLASDDSSYITGAQFIADGGYSAM